MTKNKINFIYYDDGDVVLPTPPFSSHKFRPVGNDKGKYIKVKKKKKKYILHKKIHKIYIYAINKSKNCDKSHMH